MTANSVLLKPAAIVLYVILILSSVSCASNAASQINTEASFVSIPETGSVNGQPERNSKNDLGTDLGASEIMPERANWKFGAGGLIADLDGWSNIQLPQFITASHIDVSKIATVSKFRSSASIFISSTN